MKITNQNVPPELQAKYKKLVSTNTTGAEAGKTARTRRAVRATKPKRPQDRHVNQFREAAEFVADMLIASGEKLNRADFIGQEMRRLLAGEFSPDYWKECVVLDSTTLESLPTSAARDPIASYIYNDPTKKPSRPTYPDGVIASGQMRYSGAMVGDRFEDQSITWERHTFDIVNNANGRDATPLFLAVAGSINIQATDRTCRAFRAFVYRVMICGDASPWLDSATAPVAEVSTVWPKVKEPETLPPYYSAIQQISLSARVDRLEKWREPLTATRAVVHIAPRALMGKWFNNNSSVELIMNATTKLFRPYRSIWFDGVIPGAAYTSIQFASFGTSAIAIAAPNQWWATNDVRDWGQAIAHDSRSLYQESATCGNKAFVRTTFRETYWFDKDTGQSGIVDGFLSDWVQQGIGCVLRLQYLTPYLWATFDGETWDIININWDRTYTTPKPCNGMYFSHRTGFGIESSADLINFNPCFTVPGWTRISGAAFFAGAYWFWHIAATSSMLIKSVDLQTYQVIHNGQGAASQAYCAPGDCIEIWTGSTSCRYTTDGTTWQTDTDIYGFPITTPIALGEFFGYAFKYGVYKCRRQRG